MDFGINLATSADSWRVVKRAEELGYARACSRGCSPRRYTTDRTSPPSTSMVVPVM
jgi:hypothetical protein